MAGRYKIMTILLVLLIEIIVIAFLLLTNLWFVMAVPDRVFLIVVGILLIYLFGFGHKKKQSRSK